jgi:DNA-binding NarL/FixJ family response regulator
MQVQEHLRTLLADRREVEVVGCAQNGLEALERILDLKPDVVTLDVRLAGFNGIRVLEEVKHRLPETTAIMLTNFPCSLYGNRCLALGADYYFDESLEFEKAVDVILRRSRPRDGPAREAEGDGR